MSVTETDLEQIEALLDGALSPEESTALESRVRAEPAVAAAVAEARRLRADRAEWFRACEGDPVDADLLAASIRRAAHVQTSAFRWSRWRQRLALAACLILGVGIGWLGLPSNRPGVAPVGGASASLSGDRAPRTYQVRLMDASGRLVHIQRFESIEDARQFADDLNRWQDQQGAGGAVVIHGEF